MASGLGVAARAGLLLDLPAPGSLVFSVLEGARYLGALYTLFLLLRRAVLPTQIHSLIHPNHCSGLPSNAKEGEDNSLDSTSAQSRLSPLLICLHHTPGTAVTSYVYPPPSWGQGWV